MDSEQRLYEQLNRRLDDSANRIESEVLRSDSFRVSTQEKLSECQKAMTEVALTLAAHAHDISVSVQDIEENKQTVREALGPEGWITNRLERQDAKWTRIYFLIISLLLSIITLTATLWLTAMNGGK